MFTWAHRSMLALLLMAAVGSLCVTSCFASVTPAGKTGAHACCHKNGGKGSAQRQSAKPARDCDGQPAEAAAKLLQVAAPDLPVEALTGEPPATASLPARPVLPADARPPDILTLQHVLLI